MPVEGILNASAHKLRTPTSIATDTRKKPTSKGSALPSLGMSRGRRAQTHRSTTEPMRAPRLPTMNHTENGASRSEATIQPSHASARLFLPKKRWPIPGAKIKERREPRIRRPLTDLRGTTSGLSCPSGFSLGTARRIATASARRHHYWVITRQAFSAGLTRSHSRRFTEKSTWGHPAPCHGDILIAPRRSSLPTSIRGYRVRVDSNGVMLPT